MITRLKVENYRALADVDIYLGAQQLLLGLNGSGKTSVFDVLAAVRDLVVEGERCEATFPLRTVSRWLPGPVAVQPEVLQHFEIEASGPHGQLTYRLTVEQTPAQGRSRVLSEELRCANGLLFEFKEGTVQLHRDQDCTEGPSYTFDWSRSALASVLPGPDNTRLSWFKECLRSLVCVRIEPSTMEAVSERGAGRPGRDLSNFVSWFRTAYGADAAAGAAFLAATREAVSGLANLHLQPRGQDIVALQASFEGVPSALDAFMQTPATPFKLEFGELSDGQRVLICLYALLHFATQRDATVCIDEPDNYLALAEIQPWLLAALDRASEVGAQMILASHHPELLNILAPADGIVFERTGAGPVRTRQFVGDPNSTLSPAETIARGWERG